MSDNILDFDFAALSGVDDTTLDPSWWPSIGQDFEFLVPPDNNTQYPDPSLLAQPSSIGQTLDFSALNAPGGLSFVEPLAGQGICKHPLAPHEVSLAPFMKTTAIAQIQLQQSSTLLESNTGKYRCKICSETFKYSIELFLHAQGSGHKTYACSVEGCNESFLTIWDLEFHAGNAKHKSFGCELLGCQQSFMFHAHLENHLSHPHVDGHYQVEGDIPFVCIECNEALTNRADLQRHAYSKQHSPFLCVCGTKFARVDVLHRHIASFANDHPKFPCTRCKFHRGKLGFRRRDHLVQHLRGYHKLDSDEINTISPPRKTTGVFNHPVCPYNACEFFRDDSFRALPWTKQIKQRPFSKQADLTKHLKKAHDKTPFPCDIPGCDKVGGKGYVREKDLMKHRAAKHPEADDYVPERRSETYACQKPWCSKVFRTQQKLTDHMKYVHFHRNWTEGYWASQDLQPDVKNGSS